MPEYAYDVVKLWQKFITHLIKLLLDRQLEDNVRYTKHMQTRVQHDLIFWSLLF